jgi:hypothetical protein
MVYSVLNKRQSLIIIDVVGVVDCRRTGGQKYDKLIGN